MTSWDAIEANINDLGDLHDCLIENIEINTHNDSISLKIADLNANLSGLQEYPGKASGYVNFTDVTDIDMKLDGLSSKLRIYEVTVHSRECVAEIRLSPSGSIMIGALTMSIIKE